MGLRVLLGLADRHLRTGLRARQIRAGFAIEGRQYAGTSFDWLHPFSVERLAEAACLSPRQFSRVFRAETGLPPAKAIENLRLEAARLMLEQGRLPIESVANETGFGDRERMRRSFVRAFGQTPQAIRNAARPLASF